MLFISISTIYSIKNIKAFTDIPEIYHRRHNYYKLHKTYDTQISILFFHELMTFCHQMVLRLNLLLEDTLAIINNNRYLIVISVHIGYKPDIIWGADLLWPETV